jgi:phosphoglycolate phosphatase
VVPLRRYFERLRALGLKVAVMTNDTERAARTHMERANCLDVVDFIVGFDSGFGAKPSADPLLACARHVGVSPNRCAMVGDSTHDLVAGRAAGMTAIGVLTGMAFRPELEPFADLVLNDIGEIPMLLSVS